MSLIYKPYDELSDSEKRSISETYLNKFDEFDNDIIATSTAEVLRANGFLDFKALQVGPNRSGEEFNLSAQLPINLCEHRYIFFAFPANKGQHSVAVVIDTDKKKCFLLDSQIMHYEEVEKQLRIPLLRNYDIIKPRGEAVLFQQEDDWSCGVHTAANIVGMITGDINVETGKGLATRSEDEVQHLLGLFVKAYTEVSAKREKELIFKRQIDTLRFAIEALLDENPEQEKELLEFNLALLREYPLSFSDEQLMQKKTIADFIKQFCRENKSNAFTLSLNSPELIKKFPQTVSDNVEVMTKNLRHFISEEMKINCLLSKLKLDPTDRSLDQFAKALRRASASNFLEDVQLILLLNPDVLNCQDQTMQNTALHLAIERNHCNIVEMLINANADQDIPNASGKTPIMMANESGRQQILMLIETSKKKTKESPIIHVCENTSSWRRRLLSIVPSAVVDVVQSFHRK